MNFRDDHEFDPESYQGAGGLYGSLQALMRSGQLGPDLGPNATAASEYNADIYSGQGGLLARLRAFAQQQAAYQSALEDSAQPPTAPLDPNFRQLTRVSSTSPPETARRLSDRYEFDPKIYQGAGGLFGRLQAMTGSGQFGPDPDSNIITGPEFNVGSYSGQSGLPGRLRALAQEQGAHQQPSENSAQPSSVPADPNLRQLSRVSTGAPQQSAIGAQIVDVESHGDPNAKNDRSSATGPGQFLEKTWLEMLRRYRPDLTGTREQLLALRGDPQLSREMTEAYANENAKRLSRAGHPVTAVNIYLAHFVGPGGAISVLNADPNLSVRSVLGDRPIASNPFLAKMTVGDLRTWVDRLMSGKSIQSSVPHSR
jgi:hypothetical protein